MCFTDETRRRAATLTDEEIANNLREAAAARPGNRASKLLSAVADAYERRSEVVEDV